MKEYIEKLKMSKKVFVTLGVIVAIVVLLFVGYAAGRGYKTYEISMEKNSSGMKGMNMNDGIGDHHMDNAKELVNPNVYAPKVTINAVKDSMGGYNVQILTNSFKFTPEMAGKEVVQNTGHAHVYVNEVKVGRAYGVWFNVPDSFFKNGTNTISVTLNANNHNVWWSKKGTLEARASLDVLK